MPRIRLVGVSRGQGLNVINMFLAIDCNFTNGAGKPIFGSSTSVLGRNRHSHRPWCRWPSRDLPSLLIVRANPTPRAVLVTDL